MTIYSHIPVMLKETINALSIKPNGTYLDCTFGRGGHSNEILKLLGDKGSLIAFDRDLDAINEGKKITDESFELESDFDLPDSISTDVSQLELPELDNEESGGLKIQDGLFSNIPVRVSVELGRSKLSLKDVYELSEGAIVELERLVGEPLDLVINDQIIAQGEVVAIDNKYGLRIKNLVSSTKKR